MLSRLVLYGRLIKSQHTLFSLPLLFSGAILAGGRFPSWRLSLLIVGAGAGGRAVAFVLNRIIDRHIDRQNPRTADRELPRGLLGLGEAWGVGAAGLLLYLGCAWAIAPLCFWLSPIPLMIFVVYPFMKRFTALTHFGVGLADAMAPLGGALAARPTLDQPWTVLWLAVFTFFWVTGFDVIYATLDESFDRVAGLHSFPARFGSARALHWSGAFHAAAFLALGGMAWEGRFGPLALITLAGIGALLVLEHRVAHDVELAFFKLNAVLGFGVLGFVALGTAGL